MEVLSKLFLLVYTIRQNFFDQSPGRFFSCRQIIYQHTNLSVCACICHNYTTIYFTSLSTWSVFLKSVKSVCLSLV